MLRLLLALIAVESDGNDRAIGDQGRAVGCLQIHEKVVHDVNRVYGTRFHSQHRWSREQSLQICELYLLHYAARVPGPVTWETYARIWNGGPSGWQKEATRAYWAKVQAELSRLAD